MADLVNANLTAALQGKEYDEIARAAVAMAGSGHILDWGCGEGQLTKRMVDQGAQVDSFEFDPEVDDTEVRAFELFPELAATCSNEPVRLPYSDDRFDVVLGCGVLEHVQYPLDSLLELRRVLRPGGTLLVYKLPNRTSLLEFIARVGGLPYHGMRVHDTLWGVRSTRWALGAAGFDPSWVRRANFLPLTLDHSLLNRRVGWLWGLNRRLASVPGVRLLATNVEAAATKPALSRD